MSVTLPRIQLIIVDIPIEIDFIKMLSSKFLIKDNLYDLINRNLMDSQRKELRKNPWLLFIFCYFSSGKSISNPPLRIKARSSLSTLILTLGNMIFVPSIC